MVLFWLIRQSHSESERRETVREMAGLVRWELRWMTIGLNTEQLSLYSPCLVGYLPGCSVLQLVYHGGYCPTVCHHMTKSGCVYSPHNQMWNLRWHVWHKNPDFDRAWQDRTSLQLCPGVQKACNFILWKVLQHWYDFDEIYQDDAADWTKGCLHYSWGAMFTCSVFQTWGKTNTLWMQGCVKVTTMTFSVQKCTALLVCAKLQYVLHFFIYIMIYILQVLTVAV